MKKLIVLKSGHRLTINLADLDTSHELLTIVTTELQRVRLDISQQVLVSILQGDKAAALQAIAGNDANIVWNTFLVLIGSRDIRQILYRCMATCMLDAQGATEAIVPNSFAPEGARRDFLPVAWEVAKANLLPFFEDLGFGSSTPAPSKESSPK